MKRLLILLVAGFAATAQDGGKALVERSCSKCHGLDVTSSQHNTRERWAEIVDEMVAKGLEASDTEIDQIIAYLAKTQGPQLNANKASAKELSGVLEIPLSVAEAVIDYREKHGAFKNFEEFKKAPALTGISIDAKKDRLIFQP